ncbi:MAG TPA: hypothetical protein VLH15_11505 [Dehalococcoidales bacterium]|nr:hypothetical protein [Dehalococcoidales bacterium]
MHEPYYKVVWPLGKLTYQPITLKPRPANLNEITICELSDYGFKAEVIFPIIRKLLKQRYPDIKFVEYPAFGNTHGTQESEVIAGLADKLTKYGCDLVISGVGG